MAAPPVDQGMVPVVNPQGDLVRIPEQDYGRAIQQGFQPPTPEQLQHLQTLQGAEGFGQGVAAAAEGAASALTFGVSPKLEVATGLTTPEAIAARKEVHPLLHGIGTAVGIAGPLIATAGASAPESLAAAAAEGGAKAAPGLLARVAEYTAPGLIAKAGKATQAATEALQLPGVLGRVAPSLAAGAVEGAAYTAPDVTEKALLGDPQMTWERAASEIGLGALFGGALGGATKSLAEVLPENLGEKAADWLGETAGNRNLKAAAGPGGSKAIIKRMQKQIGREDLTQIGREMGDAGLVGPLTTPEKTYALAETYKEAAGDEMGAILKAADTTAEAKPPAISDVISRARKEILEPLAENPLNQGAAKELGKALDGYEAKYAPAAPDPLRLAGEEANPLGFTELHQIRKEVSAEIYGLRGTQDPLSSKMKAAYHDFRSLISDEINQGLERSGQSSAAWKAANRRYQVGSIAQQLSEDGMLKHVSNNLLSLTEIMGGLTGAVMHGAPGAALAAVGTHFAREHASGILGWAATGAQRKLLTLAARNTRAMTDGVSAVFGGAASAAAGKEANKLTDDNYTTVAGNLNDYSNNLDRFASDLSQHVQPLRTHAPSAAEAATQFAGRTVQHLTSKLPQSPPKLAFDPVFKPSATELDIYNRHHEIAERGPVAVLQHLANGTLTDEHLETSQALYPRLHAEAQEQVMSHLAAKIAAKERVPYALRLRLAHFLGQPLEQSMTPQAILAAQLTYAGAAQQDAAQAAGGGAPGKPRNVETQFGGRLATSTQGVTQRMERA